MKLIAMTCLTAPLLVFGCGSEAATSEEAPDEAAAEVVEEATTGRSRPTMPSNWTEETMALGESTVSFYAPPNAEVGASSSGFEVIFTETNADRASIFRVNTTFADDTLDMVIDDLRPGPAATVQRFDWGAQITIDESDERFHSYAYMTIDMASNSQCTAEWSGPVGSTVPAASIATAQAFCNSIR